ncbi:hypothetical protein CEXT_341531 [Caerostris extrusa]|uniref:Uncharacterized protein n=1 Tax=Caerostris extrusa TaxID=172846 RepID=A0AAV4NEQ5_CAEEX|nr:hypothetical protein CEXT_341531 [Caerostris extrusa]
MSTAMKRRRKEEKRCGDGGTERVIPAACGGSSSTSSVLELQVRVRSMDTSDVEPVNAAVSRGNRMFQSISSLVVLEGCALQDIGIFQRNNV